MVIQMYRHISVILICAVGLILFESSAARSAENVESLTADIIKAYGGRKAIENVRSVYMKGEIKALAFDDRGTYEYYLKRGGKLRVNIRYSRSTEERILNGNKGYESSGTGFSAISDMQYFGIVYQYRQIDLPYALMNDIYRISYEGRTEVNGREVYVLGLSASGGPQLKIYVDVGKYFIVRVSGIFTMDGGSMTLSSAFSDFRKVQGIALPYIITNFAGKQEIAETIVEKYEINGSIADSVFQPVD